MTAMDLTTIVARLRHHAEAIEDALRGDQLDLGELAIEARLELPLLALAFKDLGLYGICQGCACTDEAGCPEGCMWVDDEHTLCSECLPEPVPVDVPCDAAVALEAY